MTRIPQNPEDYQPTLLLFYEEEIMGEAMFAGLAGHFSAPDQAEKLRLLSRMERCVADNVGPLLGKYGLQPRGDAELHRIGMAEAARYRGLSWPGFIGKILREFPVFITEFAALNRVAPAGDLPALAAFDAHETATIDFARYEAAADPQSRAPLLAFLATYETAERRMPA